MMAMGDVDVSGSDTSDEYVDGSIFRVKLHNFLTYNDAEFFPGPRLNLILGPNGTGKSSIVCALCVGLAGSTRLLGRADKVGQFVRHEKESGYTEIELYFRNGNKVIRRNIFRDNKSTWMVNGRDSTLKNVTGIMEAAKIQIDNLCQFLPQDKVGEFSRMNPVQLLKATETAITDGDLATQHDEIIELQNSMSDKGRELERTRSSLELKKSENSQRQKEVERIEDYETRIEETELMEKKCLWLEFEEAKREVEELKLEKKRCREKIAEARQEKIAPLEELLQKESIKLDEVKTEKTEVDGHKRQLVEKIKQEKQRMKLNEPIHAKYVEDTLPKWLLAALITECYEDYSTIIRELNNGTDRHIKASILNVEGGICHSINRPYRGDQIADYRERYGMTGFLDELVTAPDIVHEALRSHGGLHTVMVGSQRTEDIINQGGGIFSELAAPERKAAFVTPYKKYVTSVSKYGNRNVTTRTNDLKIPNILAASSANEDEKAEMKQLLDDFGLRVASVQEEITALKDQERTYAEEKRKVQHRITEIRTQRKSIIRMDEKLAEGDNKIFSLKSELAQDVSKKEEAMTRKLRNQAAKQGQQIKQCLQLSKELFKASASETGLSLQLGTQEVRVEFTQKYLKQTETILQDLREAYRLAKEHLLNMAKKAMKLKRRAEEEASWEKYEERFSQLTDDLDDLRGKIENNKAALECFRGDRSVRELYERVCAEIRDEEAQLADLESYVTEGENQITGIKGAWHAKLKDVVHQIDASFKEFFMDIGCVGEIVLDDEDPDVSKWGIQRRAQFRKNTKLSTMTAEEQSGGSLTKCPFRVVDEINQGMDVYNERKVFHRITKSSCGSKLPQYFLITPKLITGLKYHRDTKVMIILNGPWNKVRQKMWEPNNFIEEAKRKHGGTANGHAYSKKRIRT
ncbi:hypothetical protein BBO99_00003042 [Phytophthora kernoviae]|uniref:Structural maintenance of chromosomes protein 5 n=2 Tax=Phytophthora kernoviae TaxID=325452 RepID=A0A3R7H1D3_9STRA|nr:hypothetical protein G195_003762 [Phytophthora kernoviae 00238/432]RLN06419.1 hypothetical protein BBI17_003181 [Phytophthora kernoviae]RLN82264.1 hypothetical protein BBO99_00003042 [Phytophthora kernoviae]